MAAGRAGVPNTCCARRSKSRNGSVRMSIGEPFLGRLRLADTYNSDTGKLSSELRSLAKRALSECLGVGRRHLKVLARRLGGRGERFERGSLPVVGVRGDDHVDGDEQ